MEAQRNFVVCDGDVGRHVDKIAEDLAFGLALTPFRDLPVWASGDRGWVIRKGRANRLKRLCSWCEYIAHVGFLEIVATLRHPSVMCGTQRQ